MAVESLSEAMGRAVEAEVRRLADAEEQLAVLGYALTDPGRRHTLQWVVEQYGRRPYAVRSLACEVRRAEG